MESGKIIGETTRVFHRLRCVAISLVPSDDVILKKGMRLNFIREGGGMGAAGFHDSVHQITSIEVNKQPKEMVSHVDGTCAVKIGGLPEDLPPRGCVVKLINDRAPAG